VRQVSGPPTGDAGCTGAGVGEVVTEVRTIPQWSQTSSAEFTDCLQFGQRPGLLAVGVEAIGGGTLEAAVNVGGVTIGERTAPQFSQMSSIEVAT
jgi:hypothetical protein